MFATIGHRKRSNTGSQGLTEGASVTHVVLCLNLCEWGLAVCLLYSVLTELNKQTKVEKINGDYLKTCVSDFQYKNGG